MLNIPFGINLLQNYYLQFYHFATTLFTNLKSRSLPTNAQTDTEIF